MCRFRLVVVLPLAFAAGHGGLAAECSESRSTAVFAGLIPESEESTILPALVAIEEECADAPGAAARVQPLLSDARAKVRRKAIRVYGLLQPDLDAEGLAAVQRLLASSDAPEVVDTLKGARWLHAPRIVPSIAGLLGHRDEHVKREACRALAIVGDRALIPTLEPLTKDPISDVRTDCEGAIAQLRRKP